MHFAYHRENTKEKKSEETEKCLKYGWLWFVIGLRLPRGDGGNFQVCIRLSEGRYLIFGDKGAITTPFLTPLHLALKLLEPLSDSPYPIVAGGNFPLCPPAPLFLRPTSWSWSISIVSRKINGSRERMGPHPCADSEVPALGISLAHKGP